MGCGRFDCGPTIVDKTWLLYDLKPQPQPQLFQQHEFTTIRSRHGEIYQKAHLPRGVAFKCTCSLILWKGEKNSCTTLIYTNANKKSNSKNFEELQNQNDNYNTRKYNNEESNEKSCNSINKKK